MGFVVQSGTALIGCLIGRRVARIVKCDDSHKYHIHRGLAEHLRSSSAIYERFLLPTFSLKSRSTFVINPISFCGKLDLEGEIRSYGCGESVAPVKSGG